MTAVEWLANILKQSCGKEFTEGYKQLFDQAKLIEEKQRGYSEEDIKIAYEQGARLALISQSELARQKGKFPTPDEWFEQFKNK